MVDESAGFDVAFGPNGDIHVVYVPPAGGLGYAVYDGCHWTEFVVAGEGRREPLNRARPAAGRPHLAYQNVIPSQGNGNVARHDRDLVCGPATLMLLGGFVSYLTAATRNKRARK